MTAPRTHILAIACLCAWATPVAANQFDTALMEIRDGRPTSGAAIFHDLARDGDADAMFNLAILYQKGLGLPQNTETALYWAWRARLDAHPKGKQLAEQFLSGASKDVRERVLQRLQAELLETVHQKAPLSYVRLALLEGALAAKPNQIEIYANSAMAVALGFARAVPLRDQARASFSSKDAAKAENRLAEIYADWCRAQAAGSAMCGVQLVEVAR